MDSRVARLAMYALGLTVLVLASTPSLMAGTAPRAPEIDSSALSAGLGVLAAGALIIRARRK